MAFDLSLFGDDDKKPSPLLQLQTQDAMDAAQPPPDASPQAAPPVAPPAAPAAPSLPSRNGLVSQYIQSLLNKPKDDGTELRRAQALDAINTVTNGIGRGAANAANTAVRGAQSFANAIGGHGYQSSVPDIVTPPDEKQPTKVQQYLAQKKAEQESGKEQAGAIKDLAEAEKNQATADSLQQPDSLKAREVAVKEEETKRKSEQGGKGLALKGRQLDQGDEKLGLASDAQDERGRHNAALEGIQRQRIALQRELQGARDEETRQRLGVQLKRLGLMEEKLGNTEGQGVVPLAEKQDRFLSPQEANNLNDRAQAAVSVLTTLRKLKHLEEDHRLGLIAPDEAGAQAQTLLAELGPQWNSAQTKLAFSGQRGKAIAHALTDPRSVDGLVKDLLSGGTYTKTNLQTAEDLIQESLHNQGEARGVHFGDIGPGAKARQPKVKGAAPGRPGSGSGPGETPPPQGSDMVPMISPKGVRLLVPKDRVEAAIKAGGRLAE